MTIFVRKACTNFRSTLNVLYGMSVTLRHFATKNVDTYIYVSYMHADADSSLLYNLDEYRHVTDSL